MKGRHWTEEEQNEIIRLYVEEKFGGTTIAPMFNCSKGTIIHFLRKNNIEIRKYGVVFNKEETLRIINLYIDDKISSPKIAERFNCSAYCILNILKKNNVTLHPMGTFCDTRALLELSKERKGKKREEVFGKEKSKEWSDRISNSLTGIKRGPSSETHKKKISKALKGRMPKNLSLINKNKFGEGNPMYGKLGKDHPSYIHGKSYEPYDHNFNIKLKRQIRKRDNQICMLCNIHRERLKIALSVHHIDYNKENCLLPNLVSLCNSCHSKTNSNRPHWIKFFQSLLSEKYGYQYSEQGEIILNVNSN